MARRSVPKTGQLDFEELLREVEENPGKLVKLPFEADDLGGELLAILSNGLYTNPFDCIREYCQNGVDAGCSEITIKITGNSVFLRDDGSGMDFEGLRRARLFGISSKMLSQHVGFRGIGIYSGFDLCKRLRLITKKAGSTKAFELVFDFAAMKNQLDADRRITDTESKTSLIRLLSEHTEVGISDIDYDEDTHFTVVQLEEIKSFHIGILSDRAEMRSYLLQNLPIDFDDAFEYKDLITSNLINEVQGYKAIKIKLQSDHLEDETVTKDPIGGLRSPTFRLVRTDKGQKVAYLWSCLNTNRATLGDKNKLPQTIDSPANYAGLVYKVKGFTIGSRQKLRAMFTRKPQLYPWFTGEVYVLDEQVVPNAERNDFETNQARKLLEIALLTELEDLERDAESMQAAGVADERVDKYEAEITEVEGRIARNELVDVLKTYARLNEILNDLGRQKSKASPDKRDVAAKIIIRAKKIQTEFRKEAEDPTEPEEKQARATKSAGTGTRRRGTSKTDTGKSSSNEPVKTLEQTLRDANWDDSNSFWTLVSIFQSTLDEVLTPGSPVYKITLRDLEEKIVASVEDSE